MHRYLCSLADDVSSSRVSAALSFLPLAVVAAVPLIFNGSPYWLGLVAGGMCYAIAFLSFTVVTGEGGMLWLSQVIFAGGGAIATAQFVTLWHLPVLFAVLLGGITMAIAGAIIGLLTIRLGDLYVALVTLYLRASGRDAHLHPEPLQPGGPGGDPQSAGLSPGATLPSPTWRWSSSSSSPPSWSTCAVPQAGSPSGPYGTARPHRGPSV